MEKEDEETEGVNVLEERSIILQLKNLKVTQWKTCSRPQAPLTSTNYLYDLDQTTKKIVDSIIKVKNMNVCGRVKIPDFDNLYIDLTKITIPQLMILRRQYIVYSKMHTPNPEQIPQLFVQYLNTNLK